MKTAHTVGSKYEQTQNMDIAKIAKLVREDLKAFGKGWKFSVRIKRFSGGKSLNVEVIGCDQASALSRREVYDTIEKFVNAYNFDNSHVQSDYFHVRFYSDITFSPEMEVRFPRKTEVPTARLRSPRFSPPTLFRSGCGHEGA